MKKLSYLLLVLFACVTIGCDKEVTCTCTTSATGTGSEFFEPTTTTVTSEGDCPATTTASQGGLTVTTTCTED